MSAATQPFPGLRAEQQQRTIPYDLGGDRLRPCPAGRLDDASELRASAWQGALEAPLSSADLPSTPFTIYLSHLHEYKDGQL